MLRTCGGEILNIMGGNILGENSYNGMGEDTQIVHTCEKPRDSNKNESWHVDFDCNYLPQFWIQALGRTKIWLLNKLGSKNQKSSIQTTFSM